MFTLTIKRHWL